MADGDKPKDDASADKRGWFARTFGGGEEGIQWGALLGTGLTAFLGFQLGGGLLGGAVGLAGGLLLAPLINDLVFSIGKSLGWIKQPPRDTSFTPKVPTRDDPAPVRQSDGSHSKTNVRSPILENLEPPPASAMDDIVTYRKRMETLLTSGKGTEKEFSEKKTLTKELEQKMGVFLVTMPKYFENCEEYCKKGGERDKLKTAITATGLPNLSEKDIEDFVPTLRRLDGAIHEKHHKLVGTTIPMMKDVVGGQFDLETMTKEDFINKGGKAEEWDKKKPIEKIHTAMNLMDETRSKYEFGANAINWEALEGTHMKDKSPEEIYRWAENRASMEKLKRNGGKAAQYENIKEYADVVKVWQGAHDFTVKNIGAVLTDYSTFRNDVIVADADYAKRYVQNYLPLFNETGIAVFKQGKLAAALSPDGKESHILTYKDAKDTSTPQRVTLVAQKKDGVLRITHRIEGELPTTTEGWNKAKLKGDGIAVDEGLFTALKDTATKKAPEAFREMISQVAGTPLSVAALGQGTMPDRDLLRDATRGMNGLVAAGYNTDKADSSQLINLPKKKEDQQVAPVVA